MARRNLSMLVALDLWCMVHSTSGRWASGTSMTARKGKRVSSTAPGGESTLEVLRIGNRLKYPLYRLPEKGPFPLIAA